MKLFAITPDGFTGKDVISHLPSLQEKKVEYLYLRSPSLFDSVDTLAPIIYSFGIHPVVPYKQALQRKDVHLGVHFKSTEKKDFFNYPLSDKVVTTVSCHDYESAVQLLQSSAHFVFVSPVFKPLSKPDDTRKLFSRNRIRQLAETFGERVVFLGGMSWGNIAVLKDEIDLDFSVAGITMFFGDLF